MKKLLGLLAIAIAGAAGYLAITPSPIDPLAWQPQPAPLMTGVLEPNDSLMKADEKDILEDLIAAAVNDAVRKIEQASQEKMAGFTAGLNLPPGLKLPF